MMWYIGCRTEHGKDLSMRLSLVGLKALRFFLEHPGWFSGADINRAIDVAPGTLYPLLARLESKKWATSKWEDINPKKIGRPQRHLYKLTPKGTRKARAVLHEFQIAPHPAEP